MEVVERMIQAEGLSLFTSQYGPFFSPFSVTQWVLWNTKGVHRAVSVAVELWRTVPGWMCHHGHFSQEIEEVFSKYRLFVAWKPPEKKMACNCANGHLLGSRQSAPV